jgi:hypothetical protein
MSAEVPSPESGGAPAGRPFLTRGGDRHPRAGRRAEGMVRAYAITRGRTRVDAPHLRFESMVQVAPERNTQRLTFERRKIALLSTDPVSVAELAAWVAVPIGVARVLVGDLIEEGVLKLFDAPDDPTQNISLVRELIDGIRNL